MIESLLVATNVLGPFLLTNLLTNLLIPQLTASAPPRVNIVSSGGMYTVPPSRGPPVDGREVRRTHAVRADQARAQVILTALWAKRLAGSGVVSGGFWPDRRRRPTHRVPWTRETPEDRERLWRECERLTGRHAAAVPTPTPAHP